MKKDVRSFSADTFEGAQVAMEREMCRLSAGGGIVSWWSDLPFRGQDGRWHVDAYFVRTVGVAA